MKTLPLFLFAALLTGCATGGTPLDLIWPTKKSEFLESYNKETVVEGTNIVVKGETPSFFGFTTVAIQDGAMEYAKFKKQIDDVHYATGLASAYAYNSASRAAQQGVLGAIGATGLVGMPLLYKLGLSRPRKGDVAKEVVDAERAAHKAELREKVNDAGRQHPDHFTPLT